MTTEVAPSAVIVDISKALDAPPTLAEIDALIGAKHRELSRFSNAFTSLLAHAHNLEEDQAQFLDGLRTKDIKIAQLGVEIDALKSELAVKTQELFDILHPHPAEDKPIEEKAP